MLVAPFFKDGSKSSRQNFQVLILLASVLLCPALFPEKIGWLTTFVPLAVFYYLGILGQKKGSTLIRNAVLLAAGLALILGSLPALIFSVAMIPPGTAFYYAGLRKKSPVNAGFSGALLLALAWLLFWSVLGIMHQTNPYNTLLGELDKSLSEGLTLYEKSAELGPETLSRVRNAVTLLREYIPKVMPGILFSAILTISWLNLVLGNWLLKKKDRKLTPWPDYIKWKLPEPLVWLVIAAGITVFILPAPMKTIGLNVLLVAITVYFFQGLAIIASLFNKWSVPMLIRILIYALIFIQTYGIILLSFLGLADVWADFRKLENAETPPNKSV